VRFSPGDGAGAVGAVVAVFAAGTAALRRRDARIVDASEMAHDVRRILEALELDNPAGSVLTRLRSEQSRQAAILSRLEGQGRLPSSSPHKPPW